MKKRKLKKLLKALLEQQAAGQAAAPVDPGPPLNSWIITFEAILSQRPYNEQTRKNRRPNLATVKRLWGEKPLKGLKPFEISAGLQLLSPHSAVRVLGELRDCYSEAIANGAAEINPATHVKPPRADTLRERLTFDVWQRMLERAKTHPQRWMCMLLLAMVIGQRRADLARVKFSDIVTDDAGREFLRIEQQKKAGKKIGARVEIPLTLRMDCIGLTVGEVIEQCRACGAPGETMLRKKGGGPFELSSLSARFHEVIVDVLGPNAYEQHKWPSLHEVRSLSARTYHYVQGIPKPVLQVLLGHKDSEMTDLYMDDRGLSAGKWKRVEVPA